MKKESDVHETLDFIFFDMAYLKHSSPMVRRLIQEASTRQRHGKLDAVVNLRTRTVRGKIVPNPKFGKSNE
jgi:hypothetical protein